ncbi:MAG: hypothetical protein ACK55Z_27055, partial [bacterium]
DNKWYIRKFFNYLIRKRLQILKKQLKKEYKNKIPKSKLQKVNKSLPLLQKNQAMVQLNKIKK